MSSLQKTEEEERTVSVTATPPAAGPKALRIGVIQGVRVIEERILPRKGAVTFGTGPGNTFSLAASDLPKSVTLFEPRGDGYELVLDDQVQGRLESAEGKRDFTSLRASATKQGGAYRFPLTEASKGRVRLSPEITVLFHFVDPPPVAVVPTMPAEVTGGLVRSVEPIFTAVLTASFLVHFAFGIFIKVTEPPAPPSVEDLKQLVERIQPPKVETKVPPPKTTTPTDTGKPEGPGRSDGDTGGKTKSSGGDSDGGTKQAASGGSGKAGTGGSGGTGPDRDAVRKGIAGKGILQLIGGRGGGGGDGGGAVGSVFGSSGTVSDDIGGALAGTAGVGIAGGAGGGSGVTRRGTGGGGGGGDGSGGGGVGGDAVGIGQLATAGGGSVNTGTKQATTVVARVTSDDIGEIDGKIDKKSVAATIRRRQDGFQACYETALKANSKLAGKLVVEFTIAESGQVSEARVEKDGVGSAEVANCVVGLLRRLKFPAPSDGEVTITNTFVFQPG